MNGILVIVSSPSGGGKTTIIHTILNMYSEKFVYSISATTRKMRSGEVDGKDYFFLTEEQFIKDIENHRFLEWEQVHGYYYGTPKLYIDQCIRNGKYVLLDIDVNGALQVAKKYENNTITIFISPPSQIELINRLKNRKTDTEEEIEKRLKRIPVEMELSKYFNYIVINDKIDDTVNKIIEIINRFRSN